MKQILPATNDVYNQRMIRLKLLSKDDIRAVPVSGGWVRVGASPLSADIGQNPACAMRTTDGRMGALMCAEGTGSDFGRNAAKSVETALNKFRTGGWEKSAVETVLIGGCDNARWKTLKWREALREKSLAISEFEIDGMFYRKIRFEPGGGVLAVYKAPIDPDHWNPAKAKLSLEDGVRVFSDNQSGGVVANATRFFRERITFKALKEIVLPSHLENFPDEPFMFWSAACSNGAESYSYAMYIHRLYGRLGLPPNFRVFGTDINERLVAHARAGKYDIHEKDLQNYRAYFEHYGELNGNELTFGPEIRRHVAFGLFDIKQRPRRKRFNMIVCANVFQYYADPAREHFLLNFKSVVQRPGYIFVGPLSPRMIQRVGLEKVGPYNLLLAE